MSLYTRMSNNPSLFFNSTGMKLSDFALLLPKIISQYQLQEQSRKSKTVLSQQPRSRAIGGGNAYKNDVTDRVLMALMYYRLYLTQDFMALLFAVENRSTICRSIQSVQSAIEAVLPIPQRIKSAVLTMAEKSGAKLPKRISTIEEFVRAYPELTILIDGKEQPVPRPKDPIKRKDTYSGKKKRHTVKQIIGTTAKGLITDLSPAFNGSVHDFNAFKDYSSTLSQGWRKFRCVAYLDAGFQGCQQLDIPFECRQIQKAFRNSPLTQEQKELNTIRSKIRIKCEHSIGLMKKYRIASEIYRNPSQGYETTMNIVAGLANLRMIRRFETQVKQTFYW